MAGAANPLVLLHLVGGAHNEALMLGLALAGLAVARQRPAVRSPPPSSHRVFGCSATPGVAGSPDDRGRWAVAAALITLGALVKVPAVVLLPFLVVAVPGGGAARLRAAAVVLTSASVTAVRVTGLTGLGWGWLFALDAGTAPLSLLSMTTGLGLLLPGGAQEPVRAAGMLVAGGLAAALLGRAARLGAPLAAGLALLLGALLLPVVQPWYLLWGVLPLAAAAGPRLTAAVGALCLAVCLLVLPSGRHLVRPPLHGLPMLVAVSAAALVWRAGAQDQSAERPASR